MTPNSLPNWLRIILLVLSLLSYIPQLQRILANEDSSDISLYYVLFNLISATEQFVLGSFYIVTHHKEQAGVFVSDPRNVGDWLNLTQLIIVLVMSLALFVLCIYYSVDTRLHKTFVPAIYISFLLISVLPLIVDPIDDKEDPNSVWYGSIIFGTHLFYVNPIITLLGVLALFVQWRNAAALSTTGLCAQAVIFASVALSWIARVAYPTLERITLRILLNWYRDVGWAAVDNAVFAVTQLVLLCLATLQRRERADSIASFEEERPLLDDRSFLDD